MNKNPLVFDIRRSSLDDGPGIRTVVFLKGCPLRCSWCHNPESISPEREYFYEAEQCVKCGNCAEGCKYGAKILIGKSYTEQELLSVLLEDRVYYAASGGGVTFSGGEPMLYMEYVGALARKLLEHGVHSAVETCGYFDYETFSKLVLPYIDCVLYDIKLIDRAEHIKSTGKDNIVILENLRRLSLSKDINIIPRTPMITGITDTNENLSAIKFFLKSFRLDGRHVELPYNDSGLKKRKNLLFRKCE